MRPKGKLSVNVIMVRISILSDFFLQWYCAQRDVTFSVCPHDGHNKDEKGSIKKYCRDSLWFDSYFYQLHESFVHNLAMVRHPLNISRQKPTGHTFTCKHPFSEAHVIFICDISGSMSSTDGGKSHAKYEWIKKEGRLDNRLGALYASIHDFIKIRWDQGLLISNILLIAILAIRDCDSSLLLKFLIIGPPFAPFCHFMHSRWNTIPFMG